MEAPPGKIWDASRAWYGMTTCNGIDTHYNCLCTMHINYWGCTQSNVMLRACPLWSVIYRIQMKTHKKPSMPAMLCWQPGRSEERRVGTESMIEEQT